MYYFIGPDGSHGCADHKPDNVVFIDKVTYDLISENHEILDITVSGLMVKITPSFGKYKEVVARKLEVYLSSGKPDFSLLSELQLTIEYVDAPAVIFNGAILSVDEAKAHLRESVRHWQERCKEHRRLSALLASAKEFSDLDNVVAEIGG